MADVVVFAGGQGSNFERLARDLPAPHRVSALVCDVPDAPVLKRAHAMGVPAWVVSYAHGRKAAEAHALFLIDAIRPCLLVLAGFMRILSGTFVERYRERIVNIHPSLLPRHPGKDAIRRSYESSDAEVGITIHWVDEGVDTGPIIEQRSIRREATWDLAETERQVHSLEHAAYPAIVGRLLTERCDTAG